jgi:hypothetical protein
MLERPGAPIASTKRTDPLASKKCRATFEWCLPMELVDWDLVNWLMKHHGLTAEEALEDAKFWV